MSDSVTNVEIEDVLSSIRRLVSEDTKPSAANTQPKRPQKLVLTQADRVEDEQCVKAKAKAEAPLQLLETQAVDVEAEPAEVVPEAPMLDLTQEDRAPDTSLEDTIAELEAAVDTTPDVEWEADDEDVVPGGVTSFAAWRADRLAAESAVEITEVAPEDALSAETIVDPDVVEDAEVVQPLQVEPGVPQDIAETVAQVAEDAVKDAATEAADAVASSVADAEEASMMDEEGLRELVRTVVQEELQGVLGERITRNVRKLVRREINRTLASKDLD